jgi:hypothetical protein
MVQRDRDRGRLFTRNGHDWTARYPLIVEAARKNRVKQFVIDGEAVALRIDGVPDFNALHSRKHDEEVQLYAFNILSLDGEDLRDLPLTMRKANLARLLARRPEGMFVAPFQAGEIGPDLFRAACDVGLEGMVSKRSGRPYRAGRSKDWIKAKNRNHPATSRVMDDYTALARFADHRRRPHVGRNVHTQAIDVLSRHTASSNSSIRPGFRSRQIGFQFNDPVFPEVRDVVVAVAVDCRAEHEAGGLRRHLDLDQRRRVEIVTKLLTGRPDRVHVGARSVE